MYTNTREHNSNSKYFRMLLFAFAIMVSSVSLLGQAVNGTLLGTVTDASGAALADAKVRATETTTGAIHEATTNESGNYTFPDLHPGPYTITAEANGFKKRHVRTSTFSATRPRALT